MLMYVEMAYMDIIYKMQCHNLISYIGHVWKSAILWKMYQLNRFCLFFLSVYSLLPKDLTIKHLFIFTGAGVVSCGDRKKSHCSLL